MTQSGPDVESRRGLLWPVLRELMMITKLRRSSCGTTLRYSIENRLCGIKVEGLVELSKILLAAMRDLEGPDVDTPSKASN